MTRSTLILTENHQTHQMTPAVKAGSSTESSISPLNTGAPPKWRWAWRAANLPCWFSGQNLDRFAADGQRTLLQLRGSYRHYPASAHDQRLKLLNQQLGPNRLSPSQTFRFLRPPATSRGCQAPPSVPYRAMPAAKGPGQWCRWRRIGYKGLNHLACRYTRLTFPRSDQNRTSETGLADHPDRKVRNLPKLESHLAKT